MGKAVDLQRRFLIVEDGADLHCAHVKDGSLVVSCHSDLPSSLSYPLLGGVSCYVTCNEIVDV